MLAGSVVMNLFNFSHINDNTTDTVAIVVVLKISLIGGSIILVWLIIKKMKAEMATSKDEPADNILVSDMVSASHEQAKGKTIPIYKFKNIVEATAINSVLEENNISCIITSFEDLAYDGMYQLQKGWGMLQVFKSDREKAEELIKGYLEEQAKEKANLATSEKAQEPITDTSEKKFISNFIFKIFAVILVVILASGLISAIVWLIRSIFR
jgi:flagellar basal body-associated protein FliL